MIFTFNASNRITSSTGVIANVAGGLPFDSAGALVVADANTAPARFLNGWPLESSGAVAIDYGGTTVRHQNGLPLTAAGRLSTDNTNAVAGFSNGLPYTANGISIA